MNRRFLISVTLALPLCSCAAHRPKNSTAPASASRELLPEQQVQHVLNRLAFGPRPGDVAKVRAMGVDRWIDLQLQPDRIDDPGMVALLAKYPSLSAKTQDIVSDFQ